MVEIQTVTLRLGEREYTVREAPRLRAAPWRKRLIGEVKPMFEQVTGVQDVVFETPADVLRLWPVVEAIMVDGADMLFDLLLAYDPALEADRKYIESNATDKQILAAFGEVARLADPFGMIAMASTQIGRKLNGTS